MITGADRREVEYFFERNLEGVFKEPTFAGHPIGLEEYKYVVVRLTESCFDCRGEKSFWSVRDWRDIQESWFKKQLRLLGPVESQLLGDQVLLFTGVVRGIEAVAPFVSRREESHMTIRDKNRADLYNTGWCCRVGRDFYNSAAKSQDLPSRESQLLGSLAKHFTVWVVALSRIRQQDLLDRLSLF